MDTIDIGVSPDLELNNVFSKEQYYRGGADDFFYGFVKNSYMVLPQITYQKFIGSNAKRVV